MRSNKALQNDLWDLCGHEYIPIIIWIVTSQFIHMEFFIMYNIMNQD